MGIWWL